MPCLCCPLIPPSGKRGGAIKLPNTLCERTKAKKRLDKATYKALKYKCELSKRKCLLLGLYVGLIRKHKNQKPHKVLTKGIFIYLMSGGGRANTLLLGIPRNSSSLKRVYFTDYLGGQPNT